MLANFNGDDKRTKWKLKELKNWMELSQKEENGEAFKKRICAGIVGFFLKVI